jgi:uncharacterized UBP type Zn finger protein
LSEIITQIVVFEGSYQFQCQKCKANGDEQPFIIESIIRLSIPKPPGFEIAKAKLESLENPLSVIKSLQTLTNIEEIQKMLCEKGIMEACIKKKAQLGDTLLSLKDPILTQAHQLLCKMTGMIHSPEKYQELSEESIKIDQKNDEAKKKLFESRLKTKNPSLAAKVDMCLFHACQIPKEPLKALECITVHTTLMAQLLEELFREKNRDMMKSLSLMGVLKKEYTWTQHHVNLKMTEREKEDEMKMTKRQEYLDGKYFLDKDLFSKQWSSASEQDCHTCKESDLKNRMLMGSSPNYLIVSLNRFYTMAGQTFRLSTPIQFSLAQFKAFKSSYRVVAVIAHVGDSLQSGRYLTFIKKSVLGEAKEGLREDWVELENDEVQFQKGKSVILKNLCIQIVGDNCISETAHILLYEKK